MPLDNAVYDEHRDQLSWAFLGALVFFKAEALVYTGPTKISFPSWSKHLMIPLSYLSPVKHFPPRNLHHQMLSRTIRSNIPSLLRGLHRLIKGYDQLVMPNIGYKMLGSWWLFRWWSWRIWLRVRLFWWFMLVIRKLFFSRWIQMKEKDWSIRYAA